MPDSDAFFPQGSEGMACEGVPLRVLAERHGTPLFVYSASALRSAFRRIDAALREALSPLSVRHRIAYAVKANDNLQLLRLLRAEGAEADIVSGGELARVQKAGFSPASIVFSGVGKTDAELSQALNVGIGAIHVESAEELRVLGELASTTGWVARIALRVNPDVDPVTHPYIATGLHGTKFGLEIPEARALLPTILGESALSLQGIACHIGSQIQSPDALAEAVEKTANFAEECRQAGAPMRTLDAGGGWPIAYGEHDAAAPPPVEAFAQAIYRGLSRSGFQGSELTVELGRALAGPAGLLLTQVLYVKSQGDKTFVIVDAAMTELLRPALYQAEHRILTVDPKDADASAAVDVVGPVCESGDFLARSVLLPQVKRGDLLVVRDVGAYGAVMSSRYNARRRAAEVLVDDTDSQIIRRREEVEDLWAHELG